jgi:hypothetical protein
MFFSTIGFHQLEGIYFSIFIQIYKNGHPVCTVQAQVQRIFKMRNQNRIVPFDTKFNPFPGPL